MKNKKQNELIRIILDLDDLTESVSDIDTVEKLNEAIDALKNITIYEFD